MAFGAALEVSIDPDVKNTERTLCCSRSLSDAAIVCLGCTWPVWSSASQLRYSSGASPEPWYSAAEDMCDEDMLSLSSTFCSRPKASGFSSRSRRTAHGPEPSMYDAWFSSAPPCKQIGCKMDHSWGGAQPGLTPLLLDADCAQLSPPDKNTSP